MKNIPKKYQVTIYLLIILIFYGAIMPIMPLSKFMFTEDNIIKISPYKLYVSKEKDFEESSSFEMYMNKKGWTLSDEEVDSGWLYVKDNKKEYMHVDNFIHAIYKEDTIKIYKGMTYIFEWPKFVFQIVFALYILPIFIFIIYLFNLLKKSNL